ncbi:hypothetical protein GCM10027592_61810 [Spirosoma flavus]
MNRMFGMNLPSYGFFIRHVKRLRLDHVRLTVRQPDARYGLVMDDVEGAVLNDVDPDSQRAYPKRLKVNHSRQITIRGELMEQDSQILDNREGITFKN